jgi:serine/threonine protein phosphatase PrpC
VLIDQNNIYCANVGDSRAILCSAENGKMVCTPLSRDHKPSLQDELKRILEKGGRVDSFTDSDGEKIGPLRVWLKDDDVPGLAMSRSFGDSIGALAGVVHVPEIRQCKLSCDDKFVVIGSDGIWEFLKNDEVANIVYPLYLKNNAEAAADVLVKEAQNKWKMVLY